MRLIDADALVDALMTYTWRDEDERLIDDADEKREYIKQWMPDLPTVSGLVSVKDRLPEHGQTVLAWEVSGFLYVDNYDGEHDIFKIAYNNGGTVTHWQSLPEPPKEVEDD